MDQEKLKALLNLNAVMRNLEVLPVLDSETKQRIQSWEKSILFKVFGGISVQFSFSGGNCVYKTPSLKPADIVLLFSSHRHFNRMVAGQSNPILIKGIRHLSFLTNDFSWITKRLEYCLKPPETQQQSDTLLAVNTSLLLYTAAFAVPELVAYDPVAASVAKQMPAGAIQFSVLPDGPHAYIRYDGKGGASAGRGTVDDPAAVLTFRDCTTAHALLNGKMDGFGAVALGDLKIKGMVPMVDNTNLILDRIPMYLQ